MNYLQESSKEKLSIAKKQLLKAVLLINLIVLFMNFSFNFMGLPLLKYHYLIHIVLTFMAIILFDISKILPVIITLIFLEGQGRILWEYSYWARTIFDVLLLLGILKTFINKKKIVNLKMLPHLLVFFILFHIGWYLIEFFNMNSTTYVSALVSTKIYIFPIFLFLALVQEDFNIEDHSFEKIMYFLLLILFLEVGLNFYQFQQKESFLIKISNYYSQSFSKNAFLGTRFRPYATSFIPGALSMYLYLTVGILFLKNLKLPYKILRIILILVSIHALILCQVRSALVKYLLILVFIQLGQLIYLRFKSKITVAIILIFMIVLAGVQLDTLTNNNEASGSASKDEGFTYALNRILTLTDRGKLKVTRLNLTEFNESLSSKLSQYPLGLGPGSTGAAANISAETNERKPVIWAGDNLYISLFLDFGIGAIFYLGTILFIPIYFIKYLIFFLKNKSPQNFQTLLICQATIVVLIIGNWGFLGLPYNPESFFFWFFAALGIQTIYKSRLKLEQEKLATI